MLWKTCSRSECVRTLLAALQAYDFSPWVLDQLPLTRIGGRGSRRRRLETLGETYGKPADMAHRSRHNFRPSSLSPLWGKGREGVDSQTRYRLLGARLTSRDISIYPDISDKKDKSSCQPAVRSLFERRRPPSLPPCPPANLH